MNVAKATSSPAFFVEKTPFAGTPEEEKRDNCLCAQTMDQTMSGDVGLHYITRDSEYQSNN